MPFSTSLANLRVSARRGLTIPCFRRSILSAFAAVGCALVAASPSSAARGTATGDLAGAAIMQDLRSFRETGSVLYVAAHPDDENTQLITYLARGRNYRTAYLSLTRGDGGQNVLGPEFGEKLGVARTQELLAARRLDGGHQFFTRAIDFGFSKNAAETLRFWDSGQVLGDVVRVIRTFQPDVIITRFSPTAGGTHGHHTASAILALQAFKLAGDPTAFPEQLRDGRLSPWQPKRIFQNGSFGRGGPGSPSAATDLPPPIQLEISGSDPVSGMSFGEIAGRSRAMHKTQGFGNFTGGAAAAAPRSESFYLLAGEPAAKDILDGVDTTWSRVAGGDVVARLADSALHAFDERNPAASVPALLSLRQALAALPISALVADKRAQLDRILAACLGLTVETTTASAEVLPGATFPLHHTVTLTAAVPVRWVAVRYPTEKKELRTDILLQAGTPSVRDTTQTLPAATPLTQPYWLREDGAAGIARVADPSLIGLPENPPSFPVENVFEIGGQTLVIADEPVQITGTTRRHLDVIPPVSLRFVAGVELFAPGAARRVELEITSAIHDAAGQVHLEPPAGWTVTSDARQTFKLGEPGQVQRVSFTVQAPPTASSGIFGACAEINGHQVRTQRIEINYSHIPIELLQPPARLRAVALDVALRAKKIGYLPGAGDDVAEALTQLGCTVETLGGDDLTTAKLAGLDAVVIGVRAFNTRADLVPHLSTLFAYVEQGGVVVEQYNRPGRDLKTEQLAPYPLRLSNDRVTDENAAVTFLAPDHPALTTPNKITAADFTDWVQERGVYFPNQWDEHFTALLSCGDPGETPLHGGLLIARHGRGWFVYTGLAFFRQLPAGVPGAYRLFANLVSLGK